MLALDLIQKARAPDDDALQALRAKGLVEGRRPALHVAASIASATETEAEYIRHRAFDDRYFCDLITEYLRKFHEGRRSDFERLLDGKLSDLLNERQRSKKIHNLLQRLRKQGVIEPDGKTKAAVWRLQPPPSVN